ncbi:OLC1v1020139C1 [Oldenlandia corymbosa var. corymbosa]|uniref:protein-serine/threonine phosphatase n=1 Tax=Oldenlandia corymbosa var. corymbosa TaxID=529605 RepID=A0AAV1EFL9_OLDCO|nr:OLC1v1020139C1 [Oldenlandia corymbosa var. corymbosa]
MAKAMLDVFHSSDDTAAAIVRNALLVFSVEGVIVIVIVVVVMILLLLILFIIACKFKPWRRFLSSPSSSSASSRSRIIKADDLERPLISEDPNTASGQRTRIYASQEPDLQTLGSISSRWTQEPTPNQITSPFPQLTHSDSFVLDIPDTSEENVVGQTLKRPLVTNQLVEAQKAGRKDDLKFIPRFDVDTHREFLQKYKADQRSILILEVISGPSRGNRYSVKSTDTSGLPLTLGRVPPSNLVVKDSEVSGKHAQISWNSNKLKWELVDMGSLNGTFLNSHAIHHLSGSRHWGDPVELSSGDTITLGTTSEIFVHITSQTESQIPLGVGLASDPMSLRRGAKKLPMEDVCFYHWPLPGTEQFGLFGICDGHGGVGAAISVSQILPEIIASILSDQFRRENVLQNHDASDVLREAFAQTEACINHYYEGCTATAVLVWAADNESFYVQCANVGDSACFINTDGQVVKLTEDHRVTSYSERLRIQGIGEPLRDGETRLCGLNLARMLGDKFLKQQDSRFSSEPYISQALYIHQSSRSFALLASDGFWDVVNVKKAVQLVNQARERNEGDRDASAEKIANILLGEARTQRTKDNTSIIFLDFDNTNRIDSS